MGNQTSNEVADGLNDVIELFIEERGQNFFDQIFKQYAVRIRDVLRKAHLKKCNTFKEMNRIAMKIKQESDNETTVSVEPVIIETDTVIKTEPTWPDDEISNEIKIEANDYDEKANNEEDDDDDDEATTDEDEADQEDENENADTTDDDAYDQEDESEDVTEDDE